MRKGIPLLSVLEMDSTGGVACVSVKKGRVFAPGHGLIEGSRVILDDVGGCECFKGQTFLITSCTDDHFTLKIDVELCVTSAQEVEDDDRVVSILTSRPHFCELYADATDPEPLQAVLHGFGELDGLTFTAFAEGKSELHLADFLDSKEFGWENQGKVSKLQEWLSGHALTGAERILLPDADFDYKEAGVEGTGGWVQLVPRCRPLAETEANWHETLKLAFSFLCKPKPSVIATPVAPAQLMVGHCGTAQCVGPYTSIPDAGSRAGTRFQRGCIRLAFEPSLGLWAITAEARANPGDDLHCSRLILGERCLRWEGPQLLYVCLDPSPLGRWLPVLGAEPAPQGMGEKAQHTETAASFAPAQVIDGCLPPALLACIFAHVLDSPKESWGGYIDFSFFGRGVRGLSAAEIVKEISALEESARRIAAISRSCHSLVTQWRRLFPSAIRRVLYGMLAEDVDEDTDASEFAIDLMRKTDLTMNIREDSDFRTCMWGAVPWSIVVRHPVTEGLQLSTVLPALKAFVRELFQGVGLPVERHSFSFVRTMTEASDPVEWIELLQDMAQRPASLRTKPLLLCEGSTAELVLPGGKPLLHGLPRASMLLCRTLRGRNYRTVSNVEWEVLEQKGGDTCIIHSISNPWNNSSSDSCESCRRLKGAAAALVSETSLLLILEMPDASRELFELCISASGLLLRNLN